MTTPWIRTHARIGNRWDLLVGNVAFPGYRTALEARRLEDRIRQYAKSMTWDEAVARAAEEEKGHRWKPLSRKQRNAKQEKQPSPPAPQPEKAPPQSLPPVAPGPQLERKPAPPARSPAPSSPAACAGSATTDSAPHAQLTLPCAAGDAVPRTNAP